MNYVFSSLKENRTKGGHNNSLKVYNRFFQKRNWNNLFSMAMVSRKES